MIYYLIGYSLQRMTCLIVTLAIDCIQFAYQIPLGTGNEVKCNNGCSTVRQTRYIAYRNVCNTTSQNTSPYRGCPIR